MTTVVPQPAREQLPLCACGCGNQVLTPGSRYRQGHHSRDARRWIDGSILAILPPPERRHCAACGKTFTPESERTRCCSKPCAARLGGQAPKPSRRVVRRLCAIADCPNPVRSADGHYCSRRHADAAKRQGRTPKGELGKFLRRRWEESRLNLKDFSASIGINRTTVGALMEDHLPTDVTLAKLQAAYGDDLPPTETETDRRRRHGRELQAEFGDRGRTKAAGRKISASLAGRPKSPEHIASVVTSKRENGALARHSERFSEWSASSGGRIVHALFGYLRHSRRPTTGEIRNRAAEVAPRYGLSVDSVLAEWRPHLRERGLWPSAGGRPAQIDYARVHDLKQAGKKWIQIGALIGKDPEVIKAGYRRWRRAARSLTP